jgi:membrane-bound ClpP family serine protease
VGPGGIAHTHLAPDGWVVISGERWRGSAEDEVRSGDPVSVVAVEGLTLRVRKGA